MEKIMDDIMNNIGDMGNMDSMDSMEQVDPMEGLEVYFAAKSPRELTDELIKRVDSYYRHLETTGLLRKLQKSYDRYYGSSTSGMYNSSADVASGGEQGELSLVRINHYRNLVQHLLVMTTSNRPALECKSINSDVKSLSQTTLGSGILEYYMRDKRLERCAKIACLHGILYGEGYIHMRWDTNLGEAYGVSLDTQEIMTEGDIKFTNPMGPLDVVKDSNLNSQEENLWYIVVERVNKYDLAAQYPEKAKDILNVGKAKKRFTQDEILPNLSPENEQIPTYRFYHKPTSAVKEGREFLYLESGLWLFDGPLAYKKLPGGLPLFRMSPDQYDGSPFGYTNAWDLLGMCEVYDALNSTVVSNQLTFGVQSITVPKGHDITYQQLAGGMNLIEFDPELGKPEALDLTKTPQEIFLYIKDLKEEMETLSGISSVNRGNPEASLKSGAALALVSSQAVQFNSGLQGEYTALLEDVGLGVLKMIQSFSHTKRAASIAGKSRQYMVKYFSGEDLENINRVIIELTNPMSQTIAGRVEIARDLLQIPGVIKSPEQYLQVVNTGRLEPMIEGLESSLLNIRQENELLAEGKPIRAIVTEPHREHIISHGSVLSNPDVKNDGKAVSNILNHIQEHIQILATADPVLLGLLGQQSLQVPSAPPDGKSSASEVKATGERSSMSAPQPSLPSMPRNPGNNNERYDPERGM